MNWVLKVISIDKASFRFDASGKTMDLKENIALNWRQAQDFLFTPKTGGSISMFNYTVKSYVGDEEF